jgi:hypothetical protein
MAERPVILKFPAPEADEIADILSVLRNLANRTTSPVVRACLEDAAEGIEHRTNSGNLQQEGDAHQEAVG